MLAVRGVHNEDMSKMAGPGQMLLCFFGILSVLRGERRMTMKCDCRLWPTMTFMGETTCSKCGEPTETHLTRFVREQEASQ